MATQPVVPLPHWVTVRECLREYMDIVVSDMQYGSLNIYYIPHPQHTDSLSQNE